MNKRQNEGRPEGQGGLTEETGLGDQGDGSVPRKQERREDGPLAVEAKSRGGNTVPLHPVGTTEHPKCRSMSQAEATLGPHDGRGRSPILTATPVRKWEERG